ncbi:hypothetical protein LXA43DRAFT_1066641 [Ganoderma leucocontextum]|nr:hypothetical protein LXA43DRAFT_1066641 [Ganoderma leucocontextum]
MPSKTEGFLPDKRISRPASSRRLSDATTANIFNNAKQEETTLYEVGLALLEWAMCKAFGRSERAATEHWAAKISSAFLHLLAALLRTFCWYWRCSRTRGTSDAVWLEESALRSGEVWEMITRIERLAVESVSEGKNERKGKSSAGAEGEGAGNGACSEAVQVERGPGHVEEGRAGWLNLRQVEAADANTRRKAASSL